MIYGSSYSTDNINLYNENERKELSNSLNNNITSPPSRKYSKIKYSATPQDDNINNNNQFKRKKSNKKVKFNDNIEIVNVESYKQYNKIDEEYFNINSYIANYINQNNPNTNNNKINRKKCSDCSCNII